MSIEQDSSDLRRAFELLERRQAASFQKYAQRAMANIAKAASKPVTGKYLGTSSEVVNGKQVGIFANSSGGTFKALIHGSSQINPLEEMQVYKVKNSLYMMAVTKPAGQYNNCNCH